MKNAFSIAAKHSGKGVGMENKSLTIADTPSLHTSRTEHRFKRLGALGLAAAMVLGLTGLRLQAGDARFPGSRWGRPRKGCDLHPHRGLSH